ncbi:MAG: TlyA family RNA methyltransferase [Oscillospiraceae bacterium]|jgi:23S rRNA (cytidine1920-2'-O)/16S rRNA (cytidine1409-2'-O)-methyltransferase|nr:TlyA family RNA methyltransferase [Oscillospiraceae bacterium]
MKKRLDMLVVERGLETSRSRAKALIMCGSIFVNNLPAHKPGELFYHDVLIECKKTPLRYVSRGGLKLEKGLQTFAINLEGKTCMDIGCSTGGFSDCALQHGAKEILAIDVGSGQFDPTLRKDPRIHLKEKINARYLQQRDLLGLKIDFVMVDVSFISLTKIIPAISKLVRADCEFLCLVKPQFELEKAEVGKNGIVKDPLLHEKVTKKILLFVQQNNFAVAGWTTSPITGSKGNAEYLIYFKSRPS